jgi:endonuclease/exonuclease/phosphatase family metal-dependent hydrolase
MIDIGLVTFNIHGGYWDFDKNIVPIYKLPLVVQYISNANLVFLQELGYNSKKYPRLNQTSSYQLQYLKDKSGLPYYALNERTGDGILSRFPIIYTRFHTVPRGNPDHLILLHLLKLLKQK